MGVGDSWGTREEFLHPRDSHGRFRKSWKMADDVISRISDFLGKFNPRTFGSDGQAGQYAFNLSQKSPTKFAGGADLHRLRADFEHTNHALRLGQTDPSTEKFVKMMEREKLPAPDDIILSRVMTPEAFGLHADTGDQIQELTGKLIADRGYGAARLGTPLNESIPGQPRVLMTIATPKGTPIMVPGESRDDRRIFLDKGQNLRITKVKPDGQGGYFVLAVAEPGNKATPEPMRKLEPSGVTPQQREARIAGAQEITRKRVQQYRSPAPQEPTPTPAASQAPTAGAPRTETPVSQSIGQGPSTPAPSAPKATPAPAISQVDLRAEVKSAGIPAPSAGPRRLQWNTAYLGVVSGKKHPEDAVRELNSDIDKNQNLLIELKKSGSALGDLPGDIKAQQQLRDLIAEKYGLGKPAVPAPEPTPAPTEGTIELSPELRGQIGKATIPGLREAAKSYGIKVPSSKRTKSQIIEHILGELVKQEAVKRGIATPETPSSAAPTDVSKMTIPQLRAHAKEQGISIPSSITRKADIVSHIQGGGAKPSAPKPGATATRVTTDETGKVLKVQKVGPKTTSIAKPSSHDQAVRDALSSKSVAEIKRIASDSNIEVPSKIRSKSAAIDHIVNTLNEHQARTGRSSHQNVVKIASERSAAPTDVTKMTIPQLREHAKSQGIKIPSSITKKADIVAHVQGGGKTTSPVPAAKAPSAAMESKLADAYSKLRPNGGWVSIADLRDKMGGTREEQDAVLRSLARMERSGARIIPVANRKALTDREWKAAVHIGDEAQHTVSLTPEAIARLREMARGK